MGNKRMIVTDAPFAPINKKGALLTYAFCGPYLLGPFKRHNEQGRQAVRIPCWFLYRELLVPPLFH